MHRHRPLRLGRCQQVINDSHQPVVEILAREAELFIGHLKQRIEPRVQPRCGRHRNPFGKRHEGVVALRIDVGDLLGTIHLLHRETPWHGVHRPDAGGRLLTREVVDGRHHTAHKAVDLQKGAHPLGTQQLGQGLADFRIGIRKRRQRRLRALGLLDRVLRGCG